MRVIVNKNSHQPKEAKALYIYFDHKFKSHQIVHPMMEHFSGDQMAWKNLAYAIAPNLYKYEVK